MKCSHCNENEANTHIKRVINGKKEEYYLCEDCAKEMGLMDDFNFEPFSFDGFFGNLLGAGASAFNSLVGVDSCSNCGSTFNDIVNSGKVGCAECYTKFGDRLAPSIERIHGKSKHIGKYVSYEEEEKVSDKKQESLSQLKEDLKLAIKEQRFEEAAVLRDKIKEMDNKENNNG